MSRRDLLLGHSGGGAVDSNSQSESEPWQELAIVGINFTTNTSTLTLTHIITAFISRHKL